MKHGKKRKKSRFLDFEKNVKNVKNVEVITYRSIGLKTTVTPSISFVLLHAVINVGPILINN